MVNQINRRRSNIHKNGRKKRAAVKAAIGAGPGDSALVFARGVKLNSGIQLNAHQKKMLKSNPKANITLSKKKLKKMGKAARAEERILQSKGLLIKDSTMDDDDSMEEEGELAAMTSTTMEVASTGRGTTLGAPQ